MEYPKAIYKDNDLTDYRIVNNAEEEAAAGKDGYFDITKPKPETKKK